MNAWGWFGEEAGARNRRFPCKVASAGDEWYLVCAAVAAAVVSCANCFLLCVLQQVVVPVCVVLCGCGLAKPCCKMHCVGCINVAWGWFWGGSRRTKPSVFPCKVASAGNEWYLVCAAVAAAVVSCANCFLLCVLQQVVVPVCVVLCGCGLAKSCCKMHCVGCINVAWGWFWGGSRRTKPSVFPCKVAAAGDARYLVCAAVVAAVVSCANWFLRCVLQRVLGWAAWLLSSWAGWKTC